MRTHILIMTFTKERIDKIRESVNIAESQKLENIIKSNYTDIRNILEKIVELKDKRHSDDNIKIRIRNYGVLLKEFKLDIFLNIYTYFNSHYDYRAETIYMIEYKAIETFLLGQKFS